MALFPFSPTSYEHQFYDVMSDFTRLIMNTKYVCYGPMSPHANFLVNRVVRTVILLVKSCRWGDDENELEIVAHEIVADWWAGVRGKKKPSPFLDHRVTS